jgi:hypothetical protein
MRAKENEALLSGSGMTFAGQRGNVEMTHQRFCTNAEKLYNCNLISQLQKIAQMLFHFTSAKFYVGIIEKCTTAISFHNCKKNCTTVKKMHNSKKKCTIANTFIAILMWRHLRDTLRGKS